MKAKTEKKKPYIEGGSIRTWVFQQNVSLVQQSKNLNC